MAIGNAIGNFINGLKHTVMFFITATFFLFAAGTWYGAEYAATKMFYWPTYLLAASLLVYVILELEK